MHGIKTLVGRQGSDSPRNQRSFYEDDMSPVHLRCDNILLVQSQNAGGRGEGKLENTVLVLEHENHLRKKLSR